MNKDHIKKLVREIVEFIETYAEMAAEGNSGEFYDDLSLGYTFLNLTSLLDSISKHLAPLGIQIRKHDIFYTNYEILFDNEIVDTIQLNEPNWEYINDTKDKRQMTDSFKSFLAEQINR